MATQENSLEPASESELVNVKVKKKYFDLFKEICEEHELKIEKELETRLEKALIDSFNSYSSRCIHQNRALRFLKGGKDHKRKPGFDITQIEKLLTKMDTIEEQIEWLHNYLQQLQRTKETMFLGPRGLPITTTREEQYTSLTPYMQAFPQAIEEIRKKIRELEAQKIVEAEVVHKM